MIPASLISQNYTLKSEIKKLGEIAKIEATLNPFKSE
jgi:hypothetical protein